MASSGLYIRDYRTQIPGEIVGDAWMFPPVMSVNAHGRETKWQIIVQLVDAHTTAPLPIDPIYLDNAPMAEGVAGLIKVESGIVGGVIKKSVPTIVPRGKNLGKASATNVFCQALREALGLYNKQLKKARPQRRDTLTGLPPPMLAQILKTQKTPPDYAAGVYVQRKYNGVRSVATLRDGAVLMYSRRGLIYPGFSTIKAELLPVLQKYWAAGVELYLDGEIYKHGALLQDISGLARRNGADGGDIDFMVYDCFVTNRPDMIYSARRELLDEIFAGAGQFMRVKPVETIEAHTLTEVEALYRQFLAEGYEGAMVRIDAPYKYSYNEHHSRHLLKMKESLDAEYPIVGWTIGARGKAAGALMIICEKNGIKFPVTPAMELPDRMALARKMSTIEANGRTHFENHWLGKQLVVYYDELAKSGLPQRGRTKLELRTIV